MKQKIKAFWKGVKYVLKGFGEIPPPIERDESARLRRIEADVHYLKRKVEESERDIKQGRVVNHEDVLAEFSKSSTQKEGEV